MPVTVVDAADQHRYEAHGDEDQLLGFVDYRRDGEVITFTHTEVLPAAEGNGIGSTLARTVLDRARADGLGVVPQCPFIKRWIDRHPDYADLVVDG
ncbi:GNAT family N-acetyltransferase [Microlunatus soli]|uniref:Uncharacterized protein n=1 Tax=Microlunatus soli TaxID=630515 RepID=A0A1H1RWI5_9ACTN|nr:GNAT family N-acetyltransferase [Microlunatus soli]SDS40084.1 hypothetical protein SAMN04489812_1796 [Microlunatus soli]